MKNIVILISGGGSNMDAIVRASKSGDWERRIGARVVAVISNRPGAGGLALARAQGIATAVVDHKDFVSRDAFDDALAAAVDQHGQADQRNAGSAGAAAPQPALVVLAGFMRILTPEFVNRYAGRLVNIHPSLLPAFAGLHTHQRALDAGCRVTGATVHQVTVDLDHGPILTQASVPVLPGDTADQLAARVLTQEHLMYPKAIFDLLL